MQNGSNVPGYVGSRKGAADWLLQLQQTAAERERERGRKTEGARCKRILKRKRIRWRQT